MYNLRITKLWGQKHHDVPTLAINRKTIKYFTMLTIAIVYTYSDISKKVDNLKKHTAV